MSNAFEQLTAFLDRLKEARIHYNLEYNRENAIMVLPAVPGERWELEFFQDGSVEVEIFTSDGKIYGEDKLKEFLSKHCDLTAIEEVADNG